MIRTLTLALACIAAVVTPSPTLAWGAAGHRLIAEHALARLKPTARAEVDRLLALEPGATLASVSTWADETRTPATAAWHFVNFPRDGDCHYEAQRVCVASNCVVGAIERQREVLASTAPDGQRLDALKFLVHLVGDVHQPLHAGFADDRGGNAFQLQVDGEGTNLHALWDSALIQGWPGGPAALRSAVDRVGALPSRATRPQRWAEESCRIVASAGFYPPRHTLDEAYAARWSPELPGRLAAAGRRLAALLNATLLQR